MSSQLDLTTFEYIGHPGGQGHLAQARYHPRSDLLYLSNHLGCDHKIIEAVARARGVHLPNALRSSLFDELNRAAMRLREEHSAHLLAFRVYCMLVTLALPIAFVFYFLSLSLASGVFLGFLFVTYAFNLFHIRHHLGGHLYRSGTRRKAGIQRMLDRLTAPFYEFLDETFIVTPRHWVKQHQASHHVFTNHATQDYDVCKPYPFLRLHPDQKWHPFHSWQHLYAPIALAFNGLTFAAENYWLKGGRLSYLFTHYGLMIAVPACFHGVAAALLAYLMIFGSASLISGYLFQVSHNGTSTMHCEHTEKPLQLSYDEWTRQQIEESVSYGGYLTTLVFGGINLQTEHHVAPALEPLLLYFFQQDLRRVSRAHGFRYRFLPNLVSAVADYHRRLAMLAKKPVEVAG